MNVRRLIVKWFAGLLLGTLIIAVTSPLFVRSYLAQQLDPVRDCYVPVSGQQYRWRSEGYATTAIGAHGMPGRREVPTKQPSSIRIALWGDSQAEGVCVPDEDKLFARIEQIARSEAKSIVALPFARSGEDASHWLAQIPLVEKRLEIDVHLLLIVELPDLHSANNASRPSALKPARIESQSAIAARVPAFLIQAARHLVTDDQGKRLRLRFSIGPAKGISPGPVGIQQGIAAADWRSTMQEIRGISERPIVLVYAPNVPHIFDGKIVLHDSQDQQFQAMQRAAIAAGLLVVDARDVLGDAARQGRWPHGFQNGRIGSGHLNATGFRVIAEQVASALPGMDL